MFCPKCGQQNADNAAFCCSCGAPLAQQQVKQSAPSNAINTEMKSPVLAILAALLSVVALLSVIDLFKVLPNLFELLERIGDLPSDYALYMLATMAASIALTASYVVFAIGTWMLFATGTGYAQFGEKGRSLSVLGATLSVISYILLAAVLLIFGSKLGAEGTAMAGIIIAMALLICGSLSVRSMFKQIGTGNATTSTGLCVAICNGLIFLLAVIGLDNVSGIGNTDNLNGILTLLVYVGFAVMGGVHYTIASKK